MALALREGIRNSEIKRTSLGNAPYSADQIKCIKVGGGVFRMKGHENKTKLVLRKGKQDRKREKAKAEKLLSSSASFPFGTHHLHQQKSKEKSSYNQTLGRISPGHLHSEWALGGRTLGVQVPGSR